MSIKGIRWIVPGLAGCLLLGALVSSSFGATVSAGDADLYYPLHHGSHWVYKTSQSGQKESWLEKLKVLTPYGSEPRVASYRNTTPTAIVTYTRSNQGLAKVKISNMNNTFTFDPPLLMLPFKISPGVSWSWQSADQKMKETAKIGSTETVTVPAGSFTAVVVQYNGTGLDGKSYTDKTWFVKAIGFVKDVYTSDGKTSTMELLEYQIAK